MRGSESELRAVLDALPDLIFRIGRDGTFLDYHAGRPAALYVPPEGFLGRGLEEILPPDIAERLGTAILETLATGEVTNVEYTLEMDGDERSFEARIAPLDTDEVISVVRETTDLVSTRRELATRNAELRRAGRMEAVGRFAGAIAHDFNNVLTVIGGYATELERESGADGPAVGIREAVGRADALIQQLLAFSQGQQLAPSPLDLCDVVRSMEPMFRRLIDTGIELRIRRDTEHCNLTADRASVEQLVMNLALNARDAMHRGGVLEIGVDACVLEASPPRTQPLLTPGRYARLTVSDTGDGIDNDDISRIFEPFYTTKRGGGGTGLGLATVYGIAAQSGGGTRVETTLGHGSTFTVYLPLESGSPSSPDTASAEEAEELLPGGRILFVEDDAEIAWLMAEQMRGAGYDVRTVSDAAEALTAAAEASPDLVICDVNLPVMSGKELVAALRQNAADLPVIYVSGDPAARVLSEGGHRVAFVAKPYTHRDLIEALRSLTDSG